LHRCQKHTSVSRCWKLDFKFLAEQAKLKLRPDGIDDGPKAGPVNLLFPDVRKPGTYKIV
jgi:hypothetical protein